MRRNSTSSLGAFHPIMFFVCVYGISLFLAIFVCRTVYNSLHEDNSASIQFENLEMNGSGSVATVYK
jgi:hypothetical protein